MKTIDLSKEKGELVDLMINQRVSKFELRNKGKRPTYLILNTQGSFLLKTYLGFDDVIELPYIYRGMEVLFSPKQDAEEVRVI